MYYVYIMANREFGVFYTGVTSDLIRRVYEHKDGCADGFTKKYNVRNLVYFECHDEVLEAIKREKRIKRWTREYKINAIQKMNPEWNDLYETLV